MHCVSLRFCLYSIFTFKDTEIKSDSQSSQKETEESEENASLELPEAAEIQVRVTTSPALRDGDGPGDMVTLNGALVLGLSLNSVIYCRKAPLTLRW